LSSSTRGPPTLSFAYELAQRWPRAHGLLPSPFAPRRIGPRSRARASGGGELSTCLLSASRRTVDKAIPHKPHPKVLAGSREESGTRWSPSVVADLPRLSPNPVGTRQRLTQAKPRASYPARPRLASRSTGEAGPISERRLPSDSRPPTRGSHPELPARRLVTRAAGPARRRGGPKAQGGGEALPRDSQRPARPPGPSRGARPLSFPPPLPPSSVRTPRGAWPACLAP
jgi:hypothetical protein